MKNQLALLVCFSLFAVAGSGCGDDCQTYCRNQADFIDGCLPEFDQEWPDVSDGSWETKGQFVGGCTDQIDAHEVEEIEATCADAAEEDLKDCENTVSQSVLQICGEHVNDFNLSCTDYWSAATNFTPEEFEPPPPEEGDDDDDAADDDDSAPADDDDAADDDDSAPADDDDSAR